MFIHRDAEREPIANRVSEIEEAVRGQHKLAVPIVPVRMTEAWLLIDPSAIRRAADNPNGMCPLDLPPVSRLEDQPNPKGIFDSLLIAASEKSGRRREKFSRDSELAARRTRVAELIEDFSPLMQLSAFRLFRQRTEAACADL